MVDDHIDLTIVAILRHSRVAPTQCSAVFDILGTIANLKMSGKFNYLQA